MSINDSTVYQTLVDTRLNRQIAELTGYSIEDNQTAYGVLTTGIAALMVVGSYFTSGRRGGITASIVSGLGLYLCLGVEERANQHRLLTGSETPNVQSGAHQVETSSVESDQDGSPRDSSKAPGEQASATQPEAVDPTSMNSVIPSQSSLIQGDPFPSEQDVGVETLGTRELLLTKKTGGVEAILKRKSDLIKIQEADLPHYFLTSTNFNPDSETIRFILGEFNSLDKTTHGLEVHDLGLAYKKLSNNWRLVIDKNHLLTLDKSLAYQAQWELIPYQKVNEEYSIRKLDMPIRLDKHYVYITIVEQNYQDKTHYNVIYVDSQGRPIVEGELARYDLSKQELLQQIIPRSSKKVTASLYQVTPKSHQKDSVLIRQEETVLRTDGNRCGYYTLRYHLQFSRVLHQFLNIDHSEKQSFLNAIFSADKHVGVKEINNDIAQISTYLKTPKKEEEKKGASSSATEIVLSKAVEVPDELVAYRLSLEEIENKQRRMEKDPRKEEEETAATLAMLAAEGYDISKLS